MASICDGCTTRKIVFVMLAAMLASGIGGGVIAQVSYAKNSEQDNRLTTIEVHYLHVIEKMEEQTNTLNKLNTTTTQLLEQGWERNALIKQMMAKIR